MAIRTARRRAAALGLTICLAAVPSAGLGVLAATWGWNTFAPRTCGCMVAPWAFLPSLGAAAVSFVVVTGAITILLTALTWLGLPAFRWQVMTDPSPQADLDLGILASTNEAHGTSPSRSELHCALSRSKSAGWTS